MEPRAKSQTAGVRSCTLPETGKWGREWEGSAHLGVCGDSTVLLRVSSALFCGRAGRSAPFAFGGRKATWVHVSTHRHEDISLSSVGKMPECFLPGEFLGYSNTLDDCNCTQLTSLSGGVCICSETSAMDLLALHLG